VRPTLLVSILAAFVLGCSSPGEGVTILRELPPELYAMTFNIRTAAADDGPDRWENRRELVAQVIRSQKPAVVAVQEALPEQLDWLLDAFPNYTAVGEHREGGRKGEFSGLLVDNLRMRVDRMGQFWISEEPERPGSIGWDAALPRMVVWAQLGDRMTGAEVQVYGTHFDHRGEQSREHGARLIVEHLRATAVPRDIPVLVLGDLNAGESSTPLKILAEAGLRDTYRVVSPDETVVGTHHEFDGRRDGEKIDYVLCSDRFEVVAAAILAEGKDGRYPSDHFPVAALLEITPPPIESADPLESLEPLEP